MGLSTIWGVGPRDGGACYVFDGGPECGPRRYGAILRNGEASISWFPPLYRIKVRPWIPHDGGPCPVAPHVRVRVRTRGGLASGVRPASEFSAFFSILRWTRDVAAYQIIED